MGAVSFDAGFGGVLNVVVVNDDDLVFLREPPGNLAVEQRVQREDGGQHPLQAASVENGDHQFDEGALAVGEEGFAVCRFAELFGQVEGLARVGQAESLDFLVRQGRARQCVDDAVCLVQPQYLRYFRRVLEHVSRAEAEGARGLRLLDQVDRQLLQVILAAVQVKAQVLLEPKDVLDQCGPFLLDFIALEEPEQDDQGDDQQYDAELRQGEQ
ncbi:hypothetical protein SDC9_140852 [bioreactor metagenome]|uniref:Uncharacterized protein n=1 Tax=bioreactor metagenome TaxID=1076179 RepID=A0A645DW26_9ZZZZ